MPKSAKEKPRTVEKQSTVYNIYTVLACYVNLVTWYIVLGIIIIIHTLSVPSQLHVPSAVPSGDSCTWLTLSWWCSHSVRWVPWKHKKQSQYDKITYQSEKPIPITSLSNDTVKVLPWLPWGRPKPGWSSHHNQQTKFFHFLRSPEKTLRTRCLA